MKSLIYNSLRRSTLLLRSVRLLRRVKMAWKQTSIELRDEQERAVKLFHRQNLIDSYLQENPITKLQLGAGIYPLEGWLNSDLEPVTDEIIFMDATERFPFNNQTFDYVFAEHMIEHIFYPQALTMLAEIGRILKPGGKVRLATPNIKKVISVFFDNANPMSCEYVTTYAREILGLYSPELSKFQQHEPRWNIDYQHIITHFPEPGRDSTCFVVNLLFYGFGHQFLYDLPTLKAALHQNSFTDIISYSPGESDDENLRGIERHGYRLSDNVNRFESIVIEARH